MGCLLWVVWCVLSIISYNNTETDCAHTYLTSEPKLYQAAQPQQQQHLLERPSLEGILTPPLGEANTEGAEVRGLGLFWLM